MVSWVQGFASISPCQLVLTTAAGVYFMLVEFPQSRGLAFTDGKRV